MVEPAGIPKKCANIIPEILTTALMIKPRTTICLKLFEIICEDTAGKMMKAEINRVPMVLTPITMMMAVKIANA